MIAEWPDVCMKAQMEWKKESGGEYIYEAENKTLPHTRRGKAHLPSAPLLAVSDSLLWIT